MQRRMFVAGMTAGAAALVGQRAHSLAAPVGDADGPPAIDTHVHFFPPLAEKTGTHGAGQERPPAQPGDWQQAAHACGVRQVVVIESSPNPEDNQRLLDLAGRHPEIVGVVGRLPIGAINCPPLIRRFAAHRRFRGIRLRSDAVLTGLDNAAFLQHMESLADKGLAADVIGPTQLVAADRLAARLPQLRVMLEHMAGARIEGDKPDPRWLDGIAAASRHANTWLKVSHVIQSADRDADDPALNRYAPWLEAAWNAFGDDRVMFGADWPVSLRHATYARIHDLVRQFVTGRGAEASRLFFTDNARRAYGLTDPG